MNDETKLPKWAQHELARLRQQVKDLTADANAIGGEADPYDDGWSFDSDGVASRKLATRSVTARAHGLRITMTERSKGCFGIYFDAVNAYPNRAVIVPYACNCVHIYAMKEGS